MSEDLNEGDLHILSVLRGAVDDVDRPAPLEHVMARGRQHRRYRRLAASASGVLLAVAAIVTVMNLPSGPEASPGPATVAPHQRIDVELAGWSVRSNADSTLTITLRDPHLFDVEHPQLMDADRLTSTLASAGVPIVLEFHDLTAAQDGVVVDCHDTGDDLSRQVVVQDPEAADGSDGHSWVITLRPDRLPPGAVVKLVLTADRTTITDKNGAVSHGYGWGTGVLVFPSTPPPCTITSVPLPGSDLP